MVVAVHRTQFFVAANRAAMLAFIAIAIPVHIQLAKTGDTTEFVIHLLYTASTLLAGSILHSPFQHILFVVLAVAACTFAGLLGMAFLSESVLPRRLRVHVLVALFNLSVNMSLFAYVHNTIRSVMQRQARHVAEARDAAVESSRLKTQFMALMSHEIRTPVRSNLQFTASFRWLDICVCCSTSSRCGDVRRCVFVSHYGLTVK
jgi:signal transduction histidine kinase